MIKMVFGYLDESGDNGEKPGASKYVVVCLLLIKNEIILNNLAKIIFKTSDFLKKTKKGKNYLTKNGGEIKFYGFPDDRILIKTLTEISNEDIHIIAQIIDKKSKKITCSEKENILEGLLLHLLIKFAQKNPVFQKGFLTLFSLEKNSGFDFAKELLEYGKNQKLNKIIADLWFFEKSEDRFYCLKKSNEIKTKIKLNDITIEVPLKMERILPQKYHELKNNPEFLTLKLEHKSSNAVKMLQVVDLISGAIFQKYEHSDARFIDLISKRIKVMTKI